jgi:hypothetical protein
MSWLKYHIEDMANAISKQIHDMNITHDQDPIKQEDSILLAVMAKYYERSKRGQAKYGTNLDRKDVDLEGWLNHLQEELMDATLYIEKLKKEL